MAMTDIRAAVTLGASSGGEINYTVAPGNAWRIETLAFTVDLTGAGGAADVKVRFHEPSGIAIVGEAPGSSQPAGSVRRYYLAGGLNPCDSWSDAVDAGVPDSFAYMTLVEGCQIGIKCADPTTGAAVTGAVIADAVLWIEPLATGASTEPIPQLTPLAPADQAVA